MNRSALALIPALFLAGPVWAQNLIVKSVETTTQPDAEIRADGVPNLLPIPEDAILIDFDQMGQQPCWVGETVAFRGDNISAGVRFRGLPIDSRNGGGLFDECSNFGVSGHSPPNFLGFNPDAVFADGGIEKLPEIIAFTATVSSVQLNVASGGGTFGTVLLLARDADNNPIAFDTVEIDRVMQTLIVSVPGIKWVEILGNLSDGTLVVDDIAFTPE